MQQFEATLGLLKTDRMELWSFHEVIYDNDPDWIYDHGGLDAASLDEGVAPIRSL